MKTMIKYIILNIILSIFAHESKANPSSGTTFITGVGTTHFEAHRMAINMANNSRMKVRHQISTKSKDGLWHVILKVNP
jgi:hypothetical protein